MTEAAPRDLSKYVSAVLVAALVGMLIYRGVDEARRAKPMQAGAEAPAVSARLVGGGAFDLKALRGKAVMLDFWATWCPPCREEMPLLATLAREYESRGLAFVAANEIEADNAATVAAFLQQAVPQPPANMIPVYADEGTFRAYRVASLPTLYLISRDGKILDSFVGITSESTLRATIERALAER